MYGEPGRAYLYLVYGMHVCLNVVTEPAGQPAAILVRAVELLTGLELARAARLDHRARARRRPADPVARAREVARIAALPAERVASGPGLVGAAFGLETEMTGLDLCDPRSALRLEPAPAGEPRPAVRATPRIGIAYAGSPWTEVRWRLFLEGHPSVSGPVRAD